MGFFGRLLDKWAKKDREEKEKERLEAKRQDKLKAEAPEDHTALMADFKTKKDELGNN